MNETRQMKFGKGLFFLSLFADILYQPSGDWLDKLLIFLICGGIVLYSAPILRYFERCIKEREIIDERYQEFLKSKGITDTNEKTEGDA